MKLKSQNQREIALRRLFALSVRMFVYLDCTNNGWEITLLKLQTLGLRYLHVSILCLFDPLLS